jgi:phosphatidylglycerol---prolipoprotein diacylglyceryl transferase
LIAYGAFRFFHEFLRATPRVAGPISGYQFAAVAVFILGVAGFVRRRNTSIVPLPPILVEATHKS